MNAKDIGDITGLRRARDTAARSRRRGVRVNVEMLEGRELLSTLNTVATLPSPETAGPMAVDSNGNLWLAEMNKAGGPTLGKISSTGQLTNVVLPADDAGGTITSVNADSSGDVWYVISGATGGGSSGKVGLVSSSGVITEFPVTAGNTPGSATFAHGALWVAERGANSSSLVSYLPNGTQAAFPVSLAKGALTWLDTGPDGNVWFVDGSDIGTMTADGFLTEYPVATSTGAAADLSNAQLVTGSDGNLWFLTPGELDRITPSGVVSGLPTPTGNVTSLGAGNDGDLWIAFQPTNGSPLASTPGEALAMMTTTGQTTTLSDRVLTGQNVTSIVSGHDSSLWLNEGAGVIGNIDLNSLPTVTPPMITPVNIGELATDAGKTVSGVIAVFTPADSTTNAADYTATINWGDGTTTGANLVDDSSGNVDVTGTHAYATALTGSIEQATITVTGPNGAIAQIFAVIQVANAEGNVPYPALIGTAAANSSGTSSTSTTTTTSTATPVSTTTSNDDPISASTPATTPSTPVTTGTSVMTPTVVSTATSVPVTTTASTTVPASQTATSSFVSPPAKKAVLKAERALRAEERKEAIAARKALLASEHHKS